MITNADVCLLIDDWGRKMLRLTISMGIHEENISYHKKMTETAPA